MRNVFAALIGLCLCASPALALSTAKLGSHNTAASTTNVLTTTTNDCPVGSLITLTAQYATIADTLSSVTDSAGNTWQVPFDNITGTGVGMGRAYAINTTVDLPIGSTITATFAGSTVNGIIATCISGAAKTSPLDISNQTQQGVASTSATSVSSDTLAQAVEVLVGGFVGSAGAGSVTCGGSWTRSDTLNVAGGTVTVCVQVVSSTSSVAFAPTWVNATNYVTDIASFKAPTGVHNLILLGVGQ